MGFKARPVVGGHLALVRRCPIFLPRLDHSSNRFLLITIVNSLKETWISSKSSVSFSRVSLLVNVLSCCRTAWPYHDISWAHQANILDTAEKGASCRSMSMPVRNIYEDVRPKLKVHGG